MNGSNVIPILQLCVGGGIFIMMLRVSFLIGTYTNRIEQMEKAFEKWATKVERVEQKVEQVYTDLQEIRVTLKISNRGG